MKRNGLLVFAFLFSFNTGAQTTFDYLLKAAALTAAGNPDQAVVVLSEALSLSSDSRLYIARAEADLNIGDYSKAISDLNNANEIVPLSAEFYLARIYALKGDAATSLYHLELSMKSSFKKSEKEIMLDPAFSVIENKPEWRQFWKKERYSVCEKSISEIEYYLSTGKKEEAETIINDLSGNYSDNDSVKFARALINLKSGKNAETIRLISSLISRYPDNEKYLMVLADAQNASSNQSGASAIYTKLINMEVVDASLFLKRAECYKKTGEATKALNDINKFLSLYPDDKYALSLAGKTEIIAGDNLKALEYFSKNVILHLNDADCYIDRANSYFSSKSWEMAINDYGMSLDISPANDMAWLNKGIARINSNNISDACHDFRLAFKSGNKKAAEYLNKYCLK